MSCKLYKPTVINTIRARKSNVKTGTLHELKSNVGLCLWKQCQYQGQDPQPRRIDETACRRVESPQERSLASEIWERDPRISCKWENNRRSQSLNPWEFQSGRGNQAPLQSLEGREHSTSIIGHLPPWREDIARHAPHRFGKTYGRSRVASGCLRVMNKVKN